jgi:pimeloyl-ACP methyl ester carboxylesterase
MLTYDLPGHGKSENAPLPEQVYSLPGYAKHLRTLLEILNLKDIVLLGFSLGGHLANEAAGNHIGSSVRGLCTIGAPPIDHLGDFQRAFIPLPEEASLFVKNVTEYHSRIIVDAMTGSSGLQELFLEDIMRTDSMAREYLMKSIGEGIFHSEHDFLGNTEIPVLCMFGRNDKMISPEYISGERIKNLLGSRLKFSEGGEHLPEWIATEGFMMELYSFLENISG